MSRFIPILSLSLIAAFPLLAQDAGWYLVTSSKDDSHDFRIKFGSGTRDQNNQGEPMTIVVGSTLDKQKDRIDLFKWYVTDADCKQEYGHLVVLDLDGSFRFNVPFAKGSNAVGSAVAETICDVGGASSQQAVAQSPVEGERKAADDAALEKAERAAGLKGDD